VSDLTQILRNIMRRIDGQDAAIENCERLTGGANMESWRFDRAGQGFVLRYAPNPQMMEQRPFGHDVEAGIVRAAFAGGVKAPDVVAEIEPDDGIGTGYIMRRVEAEVNPVKILADPPGPLITDIARELAAIHALPHPKGVPVMDVASALADLKQRFAEYGGDRPIIALAIKYCEDHLPASAPLVLVHGDFRMGNLMVDANGLAAVLDWELAHIGDAHEDLAWGCVGAWQFGHIDKPAFGCAHLESYFAAYEAASGARVDRTRFRFWLIYRTLWWALGCLQMGDIWRQGIDRSLERAVIGRRTSENELDLLLLLEEDAPMAERGVIASDPASPSRRQGEPSMVEILEAISEWIATDIKPDAKGRDKFMAAVAMNALGMLAREAGNPVEVHDKMLCDDLLAGRRTLATPGLLAKLRMTALSKIANDSPKYAGLAKARRLWI
jgi:aminoglycoside phosphotransferase (APT) family kinase protein